ncbi:beta-xylosidase/alpha-L-arabinofuranosidase 1-like [Cocos nucifera]|uniref:Beta-xylosidase/alpha-L-arabinofuranosidase 1-like n=1 Tax=Cocos nucifera TaxID=13894 RepID=A0A8K0MU09_COCNU|nr:beta-xylosidase/alpha-L-arabinofuranosidase 1-like [Cocos nucifera]
MATFRLFFLLSLASIISPSFSRSLPQSTTPTPTQNQSLAATLPAPNPGPIESNARNYTKVCDRVRFADMGLDMDDFIYCDTSLPYEVRVEDLVGRMTLAEKVAQLGDRASGVGRIGLANYRWWSEALHGVSDVGHGTYFGDIVPGATSFPTPILTAASFNESLWLSIGQVTSTEARAMYNLGHSGLTFWSPNINLVRDPRWGRALETPGEDPFMAGRYSVNFVRGMQDVEGSEVAKDMNSRPLKTSACCKHYAAYDVDNWFFHERYSFDARVTEQDMVETFVRPFEMCVREGDASSIMCSYNLVNGIPVCADARLMSQTIRNDWQFNGYIVSDCDSVAVMVENVKWLRLDLDCGYPKDPYYETYTLSAVAQGKVRESDIDNALKNLYMVLMRVGFFDSSPAYESLGGKDVCTNGNIELATDAARQGIVLLKNNLTLPLDAKKLGLVALVGPHVQTTKTMIGNYAGVPCRYTSPFDAITREVKVNYKHGCSNVACSSQDGIILAVKAAKTANATIIIAGLDLGVEAESLDRSNLLLPGFQTKLINDVADASKGPVVLVILSGGGVDISFAQNHPKIGAIIWAGYPGEEGGQAISDVIFGHYNPGGRLPLTWYKNDYVDVIPMISMKLRPIDELGYPGRTYKFFNGTVLYPFGYGLSYTTFEYSKLNHETSSITINVNSTRYCKPLSMKPNATAPPCPAVDINSSSCDEEITFDVEVANTGNMDGSEVVQVYSKPPPEVADAPLKQLVAFQRVFVQAKGKSKLSFSLDACKALALVEKTAYVVVPSGKSTIVIGNGDGEISFPVDVKLQV